MYSPTKYSLRGVSRPRTLNKFTKGSTPTNPWFKWEPGRSRNKGSLPSISIRIKARLLKTQLSNWGCRSNKIGHCSECPIGKSQNKGRASRT
jgi:hypothetical protein